MKLKEVRQECVKTAFPLKIPLFAILDVFAVFAVPVGFFDVLIVFNLSHKLPA